MEFLCMKFDWSKIDWRRAGAAKGSFRPSWRKLSRTFFTGLLAVLPIMVTLAVVIWLIGAADSFFGGFVRLFLPNTAAWPGMGLLVSLITIFVIGLLMQAVFFRELVAWTEEQLEKVPLIKTLYSAVRDLTGFFSKKDQSRPGRVVIITFPNMPIKMIGFVTVEDLTPFGLAADQDTVAVYLPKSYQIGGHTVLIPRAYLTEIDMSFEEAMRFLITAGMSRANDAPATSGGIIVPPETQAKLP
jgi:uncharacterized membrane protein